MSSLEVRNILPGDLEPVVDVFMACFNAPPSNDGWTREAASERLEALITSRHARGAVALHGSRVVGVVVGQKERWIQAHHFNLVEMCVLSDLQRSGIGSALLRYLTGELAREGVEKIFLLTAPDGPASAFYSKFGFAPSRGRVVMVSGRLTS
jgi:ribosomal protein S18 acetylase RimI-like enzyme